MSPISTQRLALIGAAMAVAGCTGTRKRPEPPKSKEPTAVVVTAAERGGRIEAAIKAAGETKPISGAESESTLVTLQLSRPRSDDPTTYDSLFQDVEIVHCLAVPEGLEGPKVLTWGDEPAGLDDDPTDELGIRAARARLLANLQARETEAWLSKITLWRVGLVNDVPTIVLRGSAGSKIYDVVWEAWPDGWRRAGSPAPTRIRFDW